jgi:tetratricopeptide (TPR) repeat protein
VGALVFADLVLARRDQGEDVTELLEEARTRYPANKMLWWIQAGVHISDGRYAEALELLDQLIRVDIQVLPEEGPAYDKRIFGEFAHDARGLCLFRLGRDADAAEAYAEASRIDPDNIEYRAKRQVAHGRACRVGSDGSREAV